MADDWEGMYIDGKLMKEGHIIDAYEALEIIREIGMTFTLSMFNVDDDWLSEIGSLPENLGDVEREKAMFRMTAQTLPFGYDTKIMGSRGR